MAFENEYIGETNKFNDPTMRQYQINAKVKVVRTYAQQGVKGGKTEMECVILLPTEGDQTTKFYRAWLPDVSDEHFEIVLEMGHPVFGTCRAAILRAGKFCDRPHIFVMSKGVEDVLLKMNGKILKDIIVLAADLDQMADSAQDTDKSIDVIK